MKELGRREFLRLGLTGGAALLAAAAGRAPVSSAGSRRKEGGAKVEGGESALSRDLTFPVQIARFREATSVSESIEERREIINVLHSQSGLPLFCRASCQVERGDFGEMRLSLSAGLEGEPAALERNIAVAGVNFDNINFVSLETMVGREVQIVANGSFDLPLVVNDEPVSNPVSGEPVSARIDVVALRTTEGNETSILLSGGTIQGPRHFGNPLPYFMYGRGQLDGNKQTFSSWEDALNGIGVLRIANSFNEGDSSLGFAVVSSSFVYP